MSGGIQLTHFKPSQTADGEEPPAYDNIETPQPKNNLTGQGHITAYHNEGFVNSEQPENNNSAVYTINQEDVEPKIPEDARPTQAQVRKRKQSDPEERPEEEEFEFEDEDPGELNCCMQQVQNAQQAVGTFLKDNKRLLIRLFLGLLLLLYFAYFAYAMYHRFGDEGSIRLLWVTVLVVVCFIVYVIFKLQGDRIKQCMAPCLDKCSKHSTAISWALVAIIYVIVIIVILYDQIALKRGAYNLVSLAGILVYVIIMFIFSFSPSRVKWRPVAWGLALQFILALIILRTQWGQDAFEWLGARVTEFLDYTDAGSNFVFGNNYMMHFFAFKVLPIIVFFSTVVSVLYYLGVMQVLIRGISYIMQAAMDTTAGESLNAAGNIFIGQTEAPLLVRPLLPRLTRSELHAIMTGGFATIAGSVMGAYIAMGIPGNHLISASVMSAPAALAISKLFYPETQKSKTTASDVKVMEKSPESNIVAAASAGASASIRLVANIAANLIAFLALKEFVNATLTWFGVRVGLEPPLYPYLTLELICSYLLYPFALVMGVELQHCRQVAQLIGMKTFLNEFIAYEELKKLIANTDVFNNHTAYNGTWSYIRDDILLNESNTTLVGGVLSERSIVISTYALCGFANFGSIGVMLGGLGVLAPKRRPDLSRVVVRAMIAGNVACFITACISGIFFTPKF